MPTKQEWKSITRKAQWVKKSKLTKKELRDIQEGVLALERLGIYKKPDWEGGRDER